MDWKHFGSGQPNRSSLPFLQVWGVQSQEMSGHLPQLASNGKGSWEGVQGHLSVPMDCCQPWKTPEVHFCINVYLDPRPPLKKDRGVTSDLRQEMEANVLTPKTFYSFCLVLHLPPRAAAFISPFE